MATNAIPTNAVYTNVVPNSMVPTNVVPTNMATANYQPKTQSDFQYIVTLHKIDFLVQNAIEMPA